MTTFPFEPREERDRKALDARCADVWDKIAADCMTAAGDGPKGFSLRPVIDALDEYIEELRREERKRLIADKVVSLDKWKRTMGGNA